MIAFPPTAFMFEADSSAECSDDRKPVRQNLHDNIEQLRLVRFLGNPALCDFHKVDVAGFFKRVHVGSLAPRLKLFHIPVRVDGVGHACGARLQKTVKLALHVGKQAVVEYEAENQHHEGEQSHGGKGDLYPERAWQHISP